MIMLGAAWQQGLVSVTSAALMRAIELNGVAVDQNKQAFSSGRLAAKDGQLSGSEIECGMRRNREAEVADTPASEAAGLGFGRLSSAQSAGNHPPKFDLHCDMLVIWPE